jgi:hypothetical protein
MAAEPVTAKYIKLNTTRPSRHADVTAPIPFLKSNEEYGDLGFHMSWKCIVRPYTDEPEAHRHDFPQFLVFLGGDPNNMLDLEELREAPADHDGHGVYPGRAVPLSARHEEGGEAVRLLQFRSDRQVR